MAKYALTDAGLQNIETKTVTLLDAAANIGNFDTNAITIPAANLPADSVERLVVLGTDGEAIEYTIVDNEIVIGSVSTPVSNDTVLLIIIKLK